MTQQRRTNTPPKVGLSLRTSMRMVCGLTASVLALASCAAHPADGWSTGEAWPDNVRTVAIPAATNTSYYREIGPELTKAIIEAVERRTPFKVTDELHADSVLTVNITNVKLNTISQSSLTGLAQEVIVQLTIDWRWEDLDDNTLLAGSKAFTGTGLFVPTQPSHEPIEVGQRQVVNRLAADLVDRMHAAW
jgi:hypothetical protein